MVEHEHHRRRIHRKARAVHIWLIPAALVIPGAWLYLSYGACQEAESPFMLQVCGAVNWSPAAPVIVGALLLAWLARDLAALGALSTDGARPHPRHVRHGYRALEHDHKRHVRVAVWMIAAVTAVLAVGIAVLAYHTTH